MIFSTNQCREFTTRSSDIVVNNTKNLSIQNESTLKNNGNSQQIL
jgi:hypothetical protein